MDVFVKLTVPNYIYRFYADAAQNIAECTPESLMADALVSYGRILSKDIAKIAEESLPLEEYDSNP